MDAVEMQKFSVLSQEDMIEITGGSEAYDVGYQIGVGLKKGLAIIGIITLFI